MPAPKKNRRESTVATRRKRPTALDSIQATGSNRGEWLNTGIFFLFAVAVSLIGFLGLSPASPILQVDQISRVRVVADFNFTYVSELATAEKREAMRDRVPPVYRFDNTPYDEFRAYLLGLSEALTDFADIPEDASDPSLYALTPEEVAQFFNNFEAGNPYGLRDRDLAVVWNQLAPERRSAVLNESLLILEQLYREGIYEPEENTGGGANVPNLKVYNIEDQEGHLRELRLLSMEEALRTLRINLAALDVPRESSMMLFRILREGLRPNLKYDQSRTAQLVNETLRAVDPVKVSVALGDTIIEPNSRVTSEQLEQLEAYRELQVERSDVQFGADKLFWERTALTVVVLFATMIYLRLTGIGITPNRRRILLAGTALVINLLINRLLLEIGDSGAGLQNPILLALLPYLLPITLAPIMISILIGAGPGIICGGVMAFLNSLMQGNSLAVLVVSLTASLVGIYLARRVEVRASIVRAGVYAGIVMAVGAVLLGLRDSFEVTAVFYQMLTAIGTGALTGIIIIGFLPIWETLFRTTTSITLLELTDFNHPLLRRMQLEAPGSYHHSLMVANLSENAAAAVGANPLLCRACAFFHDIGKLVKPEYFTENQREGYNPHIERNPSMSALVIKSHVKEGVVLAKEYKLPEVAIEVIRQHHGTSLIQYFYYKALQQKQQAEAGQDLAVSNSNAPRIELDQVNEATYRYEGPIPTFVESAIIMLADSVEAAGRSLRKVTPQSIDELIAKIITARVEDGQLDNCPLTFQQLAKIRESFSFTLLNMLHARVEYPKEALEGAKAKKKAQRKGTSAAPFAELGRSLDQSGYSPNPDTAPPKPLKEENGGDQTENEKEESASEAEDEKGEELPASSAKEPNEGADDGKNR
jgi:hypothetical protein